MNNYSVSENSSTPKSDNKEANLNDVLHNIYDEKEDEIDMETYRN